MEIGNTNLGQDDYLKLMISQIKNQDPLDPVKNKEFISQMAQMTQVHGISEMNSNIEQLTSFNQLSSAASLVGRNVEYNAEDADTTYSGTVDQVTRNGGKTLFSINGTNVTADKIISVH